MTSPAPHAQLSSRKRPLQARSRATVDVILEAAARVLAQGSLAALNTNRVAEVAGVSVGSLYQYFPNKSALVAAVIAQANERLAQSIEAIAAQRFARLSDAVSALVGAAIEQQFGNPMLAAALDHEERRLGAELEANGAFEAQVRIVFAVAKVIRGHTEATDKRAAQLLAKDCLLIAKALIDEAGQSHTRKPLGLHERVVNSLMGCLLFRLSLRTLSKK